MKRIFNRIASIVLILAMVAPMVPVLKVSAWGQDTFDEYWAIPSSSFLGGTLDFEATDKNNVNDYINSADETFKKFNSVWSAVLPVENIYQIGNVQTINGSRAMNFNGFFGAVYTRDVINNGYTFSYEMQADATASRTPFAVFFRGDQVDFLDTTRPTNLGNGGYKTTYFESDGGINRFIGGSGFALWVSDKYELTLVVKTIRDADGKNDKDEINRIENTKGSFSESGVDNLFVRFQTDIDLSNGMHKYTIIDNGTDYIGIMVDDTPIAYIRLSKLAQYDGRKSFLSVPNYAKLDQEDRKVIRYTGSLQSDTARYYQHIAVFSASGVPVAETYWGLARNYSRIAFAGRGDTTANGIFVDNVKFGEYNENSGLVQEFKDNASNLIDTNDAIYLPVTIRDFAADGILFEFLDQRNDQNNAYDKITPPVAQITMHNDNILGKQIGDYAGSSVDRTMYSVYLPIRDFSTVECKYDGRQTDGSYRYTSTGGNPGISYKIPNVTGHTLKLNDFWGVSIAYRFVSDYASKSGSLSTMYTYDSAWAATDEKRELYCYHVNNNTGNTYPAIGHGQGASYDTRDNFGKCGDPNYSSYSLAFFPTCDKPGGGRYDEKTGESKFIKADGTKYDGDQSFDTVRFEFANASDLAKNNGVTVEILYIALISRMERNTEEGNTDMNGTRGGITNIEPKSETFTEATSSTAMATVHQSGYFADSIYPYVRYDDIGSDSYISFVLSNNGTPLSRLETNRYVYGFVNTPHRITGYVYLRYRTGTSGLTFGIYDDTSGGWLVARQEYISDGQWHDIVIPVNSHGNHFNKMRFDPIRNGNGSVDISALRFYFPGEIEPMWESNNLVGSISETSLGINYAVKNSNNTVTQQTPNVSRGYYSPESYSQNGTLHILNWQGARNEGNIGNYSMAMPNVNTGAAADAKYVSIRYRTDTTIPGGITYHYGDGSNMKTQSFLPIADGKWHIQVLCVSDFTGQVKDIKLTFDAENGAKHIEVAELCFYKDRKSATYYTNSYDPNNDYRSMAGFGLFNRSDPEEATGFNFGERASFGNTSTHFLPNMTDLGIIWQNSVMQKLVEPQLVDGKLKYDDSVILYIAVLLKTYFDDKFKSEEVNGDRWYASLHGDANMYLAGLVGLDYPIDLPTFLKKYCINNNVLLNTTAGNYNVYNSLSELQQAATRAAKGEANPLTYQDISYFLLHNLFTNAYGQEITNYNAIKLIKGTASDGAVAYTFDTARTDTRYDTTSGIISNTQVADIPLKDGKESAGFFWNEYQFNPLGSGRQAGAEALGMGDSEHLVLQHIDEYTDRGYNYHFTMHSKAKFVYYKDQNYFFNFQGDDDVYLFIDGKLILDMGGARSCVRGTVYLNNYVGVGEGKIDLKDGEEYDFEFYYMERHAEATNFAVSTNIELFSPTMKVEKNAYQLDDNNEWRDLEYGDNVSIDKYVDYEFSMINMDPDTYTLTNLVFEDSKIGVKLDHINGLTTYDLANLANGETDERDFSNIVITVYDDDDTTTTGDITYTNANDETIKSVLKNGLRPGYSIKIRGLKYKLLRADIQKEYFDNTIVASSGYKNAAGELITITDRAEFLVNASSLHIYLEKDSPRAFNVLDVFNNDSRIGKSDFETFINAQSGTHPTIASAAVILCDGRKIAVDADNDLYMIENGAMSNTATNVIGNFGKINNITVTEHKTGRATFSFKINVVENLYAAGAAENDPPYGTATYEYGPFTVSVYTYSAEDMDYVLDYGLPVKVSSGMSSSSSNGDSTYYYNEKDVLSISDNPNPTEAMFIGNSGGTNNYGGFTGINTDMVTYTPTAFIEGADHFVSSVGVSEDPGAADAYSVTKGIKMTKTVSFIPASVMYYEESIGSIKVGNGMSKHSGNSYFQSADQDTPYGYDPVYNNDKTLTGNADVSQSSGAFVWYSNAALSCGPVITGGQGGFDNFGYDYNFSNGSYASVDTKDIVKDTQNGTPVMSFTFNGTGFELLSSTNLSSGIINVLIYEGSEAKTKVLTRTDAAGNSFNVTVPDTIYNRPVCLTYTAGEIYQVPVFKWDAGIDKTKTYTVEVYASNSDHAFMYRTLYIDGVRIYDPISDTSKYSIKESGAEIYAVKDLILKQDILNAGAAVGTIATDGAFNNYVYIGAEGSVVEKIYGNGGATWGISGGSSGMTNNDSDEVFNEYLYERVGPNHECYIAPGTALVFNLKKDANYTDAERTFQVETRLIESATTAGNKAVNVKYGTSSKQSTYSVGSYTAMYTELSGLDVANTTTRVAISPTDGMICVTNIKVKGYIIEKIAPEGDFGNVSDTTVYNDIADTMYAVIGDKALYNTELEMVSVKTQSQVKVGDDIVIKIVANADAENVRVLDENGVDVKIKSQTVKKYGDTTIITAVISADKAGTYDYKITVSDADYKLAVDYVVKTISVVE